MYKAAANRMNYTLQQEILKKWFAKYRYSPGQGGFVAAGNTGSAPMYVRNTGSSVIDSSKNPVYAFIDRLRFGDQ